MLYVSPAAAAAPPAPPAPASPASSEPALPGPLDEDHAVLWALQSNPALRAARAERAVAEGQIKSATALQNPSLRVELLHAQETSAARLGFDAMLQWTPPQPVGLLAQRDGARAHRDQVQHEIAEQEWAVASAVRLCHATLLELGEQMRLYTAALELRKRVVALLRTRMHHGGATALEVNLADLALTRAARERDDLTLRTAQAQAQLRGLLGVVAAADLPLLGSLSPDLPDQPTPDPARLSAQALQNRPLLHAARARLQVDEQAVRLQRSRRWPWLQLSGRYRENGTSSYPHDVQLGVELTVPVLNQNAGPLQVAQAERARDGLSLEAQAQAVTQAIYAACAELKVHRDILLRHQREVTPILTAHERLMEAAARGAEVDVVALLSSEELVLRARRDHLDARLSYRRSWLALQAAVGAPIQKEVQP